MVVDWVPNRERRPAGRVSFAQTGRRSRPRQARTLQGQGVPAIDLNFQFSRRKSDLTPLKK